MSGNLPVLRMRNLLANVMFRLFIAPRLGVVGTGATIVRPDTIFGPEQIALGSNAYVSAGAFLTAFASPGLHIGDNCRIGRDNRIVALKSVRIERDVMTASNVYIADNRHGYEDVSLPVHAQPLRQLEHVVIGEGTWLGQNVCVIGAHVGKGCVIGANSVVLSDIPDHCVAVGSPARVIKKQNGSTGVWCRVSD